MTTTKKSIEYRIGKIFQEFDKVMYYDYLKKTERFQTEYKKRTNCLPIIDYVDYPIPDGEKFPVFHVKFHEPIYITFNTPLSMFRSISGRFAVDKGKRHFFFQLGLIPVYFASMNTMSMLKLYQSRAEEIFDTSSDFFENTRCIELSHKNKFEKLNPAKFSSTNIIEQFIAKASIAGETISNWFYKQYFTYGFWLQPRTGFIPSTHMEFGNEMNAVFKLSKSIYSIDKIGNKETIVVAGKDIEVYNAYVKSVFVDTMNFEKPITAHIEASILDRLTNNDPNKFPLLNGIMMEIRDKESMANRDFKKIITVGADCGRSYADLIQLVSGMLCYRICREKDIVSKLLPVKGFKSAAEILCRDWMEGANIAKNPLDDIDNDFYTAIDRMFPMIVLDGDTLYFTNPLVIGFLKKWDLIDNPTESHRSILLLLLPLLDKIAAFPWQERRKKIIKEENYNKLAKLVNDASFSTSLINLVKEINLSNLIRKTYQTKVSIDGNANNKHG